MNFTFAGARPTREIRHLRQRVTLIAVAAGLAFALTGCGAFDDWNPFGNERYKTKIEPETPASQVYDQGLGKLSNGSPQDAAKKFTALGKQYPGSDWARKGLLMTTYAQYEANDYDSAAESGKRYVKEYGTTPEAAYAQYLVANSYYAQVLDVSRDQDRAKDALDAFGQVLKNYPKSEYVDDSKFKVQVMRDQLAGKEMSIGRFYLNRRNYTAAINRFRVVLADYQTTRHTEEALYRLTEAYLGLGITDEAETAAAILGHNFPDGQWYKDAYALLGKGGLKPEDHQDSWMSKLYKAVIPS